MNIQHATPPESFTSAPLTPPPTDDKSTSPASRIIREIRNQQEGRKLTSIPWASYNLDVEGYEDLLLRLQVDESLCGFAQHKLRYDYFPSANRFVLRMPTALHETFIANIVEEIQIQLKSIQGPAASFAKKISSRGSTSIKFRDEEYGKHDPDAQFQYLEAPYPGVVIEVSYSQKRKDLARLADDYILGSDSDIRAVVGLDIEYSANKEATLSVWRPNIETNDAGEKELVAQQTITNQVFRDSDGKPSVSRTGGLQLRLRDFTTEDLAQPNGRLRDPIFISANTLCSFLENAERNASVATQQTSIITSAKPWVRKRRRERTPPEELKHNDEKRFRVDENRAVDQATKDDSSYKTGSTSDTESN
ncbi:hypothetical protein VC83_06264 [Pseudogymnoascus destructans]|uniref:Uncharacterized protein n=2 Tax=Pseudogymnoascus destructans TaxID=655981 RepID=L8G1M4_PSED2|nr:uncharacterized protein VC83_06264 [Pseudogymnoascus destructans]ELR06578.1 hypothetical protein GMDG_08051 [Pseudogymnoascus destructans 20631-21]OAF58964.1 hypothetical protein VC83_06264 [Pseudogymnoascus destructans]